MASEHFTAQQAAHLAGFGSVMMLNYIERESVFEREEVGKVELAAQRRHGRRRSYSFRDVVILRAIQQLLEKGVSVARIKLAMLSLSRDENFLCEKNSLQYNKKPVQFFVTDGKEIFFCGLEGSLVSLTQSGQQAFTFVLDIQRMCAEVAAKPTRRKQA